MDGKKFWRQSCFWLDRWADDEKKYYVLVTYIRFFYDFEPKTYENESVRWIHNYNSRV
jgi:hypothetical protein